MHHEQTDLRYTADHVHSRKRLAEWAPIEIEVQGREADSAAILKMLTARYISAPNHAQFLHIVHE